MIISHQHKFIFIKTKKTAGTSIEIAFSKICGDADVITPIMPEDESIRQALGYRGPQNYSVQRTHLFYNHMPARDIRARVGDEVWNGYFKFCFERNPWDKVISWYFYRHQTEPRPSIPEFIQAAAEGSAGDPGGFDLYSIDGRIAVDRVCLYENINQELEYIQARLKLPDIPALPRAKSGFRKDKRSYREVLGMEERTTVARLFAREIAHLGFTF